MKYQPFQKVRIDGFPEGGQSLACQKKGQKKYREKERIHEWVKRFSIKRWNSSEERPHLNQP